MNRVFGATAVLAVLATGCATRGTVNRLQTDVAALRTEVAAGRATQELAARDLALARAELEALAARARDLGEGVRAAGEELAKLAARLDAAEEENRKTRALLEARAPAAPAPAPAAPAERRAEARPEPRVTPRAAEQAYGAALTTFRAREYGQAVLDFTDFIGTYPKHALAANAQYWIGEAYYVQRDRRQALVEFQKVLDMRSGKIPDALLKIGLCHWALRDQRRARAAWQSVVRDYPGTESARIARGLLRKPAEARR